MSDDTRKRPPLGLPKRSPVIVTHVRANNDVNGNPRRCFVVRDLDGAHVETIDEGYYGEAALYSRYPWFMHIAADRLGLKPAYAAMIDSTPSEYKRLLRASVHDGTGPTRIRDRADRYARRFDPFGQPR